MNSVEQSMNICSTAAQHTFLTKNVTESFVSMTDPIPRQQCRVKEQDVEQVKTIKLLVQCLTKTKLHLNFSWLLHGLHLSRNVNNQINSPCCC
jgi:hypothetical protein